MKFFAAFACACLLTLILPCEARAQSPRSENRLILRPHLFKVPDGKDIEGQWGVLKVPEERRNPEARTLELAFVRLPSTAREPGPPIVYLAGGPGNSGIESARGPRLPVLLSLREIADVILLDQRGTGSSRPGLICWDSWVYPPAEPLDPTAALDTIKEIARSCAESMKKEGTNLSAYNAREIADDLEDLRQALGAPQISLLATSYGTHLALAAIRRHEPRIHGAVLMGVVGPDHTLKLPQMIQQGLATPSVNPGSGASGTSTLGVVLSRISRQSPYASAPAARRC
ncbi:MAG: alpha/beta hydrolase [bacterium]|nr:alpha/beta hydrolase [bacterium]